MDVHNKKKKLIGREEMEEMEFQLKNGGKGDEADLMSSPRSEVWFSIDGSDANGVITEKYAGQSKLFDWIKENELFAIARELYKDKYTIEILIESNERDIDAALDEMNVALVDKHRFRSALESLKFESKTAIDDDAVSAILEDIEVSNPLVVILGIGKYHGLADLPGVRADYKNLLNEFVKHWKYFAFYKDSTDKIVYSNDFGYHNTNIVKENFQIEWKSEEELEWFIEEARKCVVKNKHDGLIVAVTSHGKEDKTIILSDLKEYKLECLCNIFTPQYKHIMNDYEEPAEQTDILVKIPKIFLVDACRGDAHAKPYLVEFIYVQYNLEQVI